MKNTNKRLKLLLFSLIFSLFLALIGINKIEKQIIDISHCPQEILAIYHEEATQIHPNKIVLKPWKGRHNVHGIFMLPVEDSSSKMLVLSIPGAGTFCGGAYSVGTSFEGVQAKPGHYLLGAFFRTRTATWLIARGFANQLKNSHNWILINY